MVPTSGSVPFQSSYQHQLLVVVPAVLSITTVKKHCVLSYQASPLLVETNLSYLGAFLPPACLELVCHSLPVGVSCCGCRSLQYVSLLLRSIFSSGSPASMLPTLLHP